MGGAISIVVLVLVGFVLFCIYFIFKQLEFVLVSVNLYRQMVHRQDAIVKLLLDIRDNTKTFQKTPGDNAVDSDDDDISESAPVASELVDPEENSPYECNDCGGPVWLDDVKCRRCGASVEELENPDTDDGTGPESKPARKNPSAGNFCFHCGEALSTQAPRACPKCGKAL